VTIRASVAKELNLYHKVKFNTFRRNVWSVAERWDKSPKPRGGYSINAQSQAEGLPGKPIKWSAWSQIDNCRLQIADFLEHQDFVLRISFIIHNSSVLRFNISRGSAFPGILSAIPWTTSGITFRCFSLTWAGG